MPWRDRPLTNHPIAYLISLGLLTMPSPVLAHAGHGHEFESQPVGATSAIQVDAKTAQRLGLKVEPVTRTSLTFGLKTTGQIEALPNQTVEVTMPVGGTVVRLLVNPGDRVQAGQAVAMMTSPDLATLRTEALDRRTEAIAATQSAQADLQLAQHNYQQQQAIVTATIQQAQIAVKVAQDRYDKDRQLWQQGAIPHRTMLESETHLATANTELTKAKSALEVSAAQAQLKQAESAVQSAKARLGLSGSTYQARLRQLGTAPNADGTITITAPIAGIVADRSTTLGESGQDAGKKILTIVNDTSVQVSANIYEKDLAQVQAGQQVRVSSKALPHRWFSGRIQMIGSTVDASSRVIPVKAILDNADGGLKPGMFMEIEVLTDRTATPLITIPKSAVVETPDRQTIVFVQNGTAFEPLPVSLGRESGDRVEVQSGLFEGDRVVTQRANQLYAQSLRSGPAASANPTPNPTPVSETMLSALGSRPLPTWGMVLLSAGIAASTFGAGMAWARWRDRGGSPPATCIADPDIPIESEEKIIPLSDGVGDSSLVPHRPPHP